MTLADAPCPAVDPKPVAVRRQSFAGHALHGEGTLRRAIYPQLTGSRRLFVGLAEFAPGTEPHVFHRHTTEVVGAPGAQHRLTYASDFEEFHFVVAHRVFNTGTRTMKVLYGGTPPALMESIL